MTEEQESAGSFSREYVERLRREAGKHRVRAEAAEAEVRRLEQGKAVGTEHARHPGRETSQMAPYDADLSDGLRRLYVQGLRQRVDEYRARAEAAEAEIQGLRQRIDGGTEIAQAGEGVGRR